jgi:hypothetical protein
MTTISDEIENIVTGSPFLKEALIKDLINISALARDIKPELEKNLHKKITTAAINMALKRYLFKIKKNKIFSTDIKKHYGDLTLRSGLFENTYKNSLNLSKAISKILDVIKIDDSVYFTFTKGIWQSTVIASQILEKEIDKILIDELIIEKFNNLSSITIRLTNGHIAIPGICDYPLKVLSWYGINIIEVVSTYEELSIILRSEDVDKAFIKLNKYLK